MNDLKFIFCNVYRIPSGLMFIPAVENHVMVSSVTRVKTYIGCFAMDDSFLEDICTKFQFVDMDDNQRLVSYYMFIGE